MSSFMVSDDLINWILSLLGGPGRKPQNAKRFFLRELDIDENEVDFDELGTMIKTMNYDALAERYGDTAEEFDFKYVFKHQVNKLQVFMDIRCLLYQCTEGDVSEQPLFKALENLKNVVAYYIIEELPGWEACRWG